jgi:hypothetical protein
MFFFQSIFVHFAQRHQPKTDPWDQKTVSPPNIRGSIPRLLKPVPLVRFNFAPWKRSRVRLLTSDPVAADLFVTTEKYPLSSISTGTHDSGRKPDFPA